VRIIKPAQKQKYNSKYYKYARTKAAQTNKQTNNQYYYINTVTEVVGEEQ
jgi:hypothetical protein